MIAASLAFAGMGAFVKLAANAGVPTAQIVFYRSLISMFLVYGILRWRGMPIYSPHWRAHLLRSLSGVGSLITLFSALTLLPLATATTLNYSSPLFVALLLAVLRIRPLCSVTLAALAAGLLGIVLLLRPTVDPGHWLGIYLALGSAVMSALSVLNMRRLGQLGEPTWRTVFYFSVFASLLTLPWYLASAPWRGIDPTGALMVLGVAVGSLLGQVMITFAYQHAETLVTASLGYSQVVFSSLIGFWLWQEVPAGDAWLGIPLIVASGVATMLSQKSSPQKTS